MLSKTWFGKLLDVQDIVPECFSVFLEQRKLPLEDEIQALSALLVKTES